MKKKEQPTPKPKKSQEIGAGFLCKFKNGKLVIPKNTSLVDAKLMWDELAFMRTVVVASQASLAWWVYNELGRDSVVQIVGNEGYATRLISVAKNTIEVREKHSTYPFTLEQLSILATLSDEPAKQAKIAAGTVDGDWSPLMMRSEITGKPPEILVCEQSVYRIGRLLDSLSEFPEYVTQVRAMIREFTPTKQVHSGKPRRGG